MLPDIVEPSALKPSDWNDVDAVIDANIFRPWVNTSGAGGGAADDDLGSFGPIALYVGGSGEVHFRDVSYRDLSLKRVVRNSCRPATASCAHAVLLFIRVGLPPISTATATWTSSPVRSSSSDRTFTKVREFYMALSTNPSTSFSPNWLEFAGDFTGDGWPDVLLASTSNTRFT
jgi:hypothetical protein